MMTIQIPPAIQFSPTTPGPHRTSTTLSFLQFVGLILGNVQGTLQIAQAISRAKKAIHSAVGAGESSFQLSPEDHRVLVTVCQQRQMHMFDFEQLETFFNAITEAQAS